jgi:hypothetical protein
MMAGTHDWKDVWITRTGAIACGRAHTVRHGAHVPPSVWQQSDDYIRTYLNRVDRVRSLIQTMTGESV